MSAPVDAAGDGRQVFLQRGLRPGRAAHRHRRPPGRAPRRRDGALDAGALGEELAAALPGGARLRVTDGDAPVIGAGGGAGAATPAWPTPRSAG